MASKAGRRASACARHPMAVSLFVSRQYLRQRRWLQPDLSSREDATDPARGASRAAGGVGLVATGLALAIRVLLLVVGLVLRAALLDGAPPRLVLDVPAHGALERGVEVG